MGLANIIRSEKLPEIVSRQKLIAVFIMEAIHESRLADNVDFSPPDNRNVMLLPAHILSHLGIYEQMFGAIKTCKSR